MNPPKYIIDTNILIRRTEHDLYDESSFPNHWLNFDKLVDKGIIISTPSVYDEIKLIEDSISMWCDKHENMFTPHQITNIVKNLTLLKMN